MASGRLFKRSGTKFRFRGLPEDPKIIITDPFYEEKGGMTTTTRHDNSETPEPGQPPSSSHSGMKYLVRTSPQFDDSYTRFITDAMESSDFAIDEQTQLDLRNLNHFYGTLPRTVLSSYWQLT